MSTVVPPDLAALARASRKAGLLTLGGAGVVLLSIGYSVWRLGDTENQLATEQRQAEKLKREVADLDAKLDGKRIELDAKDRELKEQAKARADLDGRVAALKGQEVVLREQVKKASAETAEFETQLAVLRREAGLIRDKLRQEFADPQKAHELWAKPEYRRVATAFLVTPTGTALRLKPDPTSPTGQAFEFTVGLRFPDNSRLTQSMKGDIKSVTYDLNHPYLKMPPLVTKNPADNFQVKFKAAGTLRNVVVRIDVAGAGVVSLDFDMTKAFPNLPEK